MFFCESHDTNFINKSFHFHRSHRDSAVPLVKQSPENTVARDIVASKILWLAAKQRTTDIQLELHIRKVIIDRIMKFHMFKNALLLGPRCSNLYIMYLCSISPQIQIDLLRFVYNNLEDTLHLCLYEVNLLISSESKRDIKNISFVLHTTYVEKLSVFCNKIFRIRMS